MEDNRERRLVMYRISYIIDGYYQTITINANSEVQSKNIFEMFNTINDKQVIGINRIKRIEESDLKSNELVFSFENVINQIANAIDDFSYNFDPYEYNDSVNSVEENVEEIKQALKNEPCEALDKLKFYLKDIADNNMNTALIENYGKDAEKLLKVISLVEKHHSDILKEESKNMSNFLGKRLMRPLKGR